MTRGFFPSKGLLSKPAKQTGEEGSRQKRALWWWVWWGGGEGARREFPAGNVIWPRGFKGRGERVSERHREGMRESEGAREPSRRSKCASLAVAALRLCACM